MAKTSLIINDLQTVSNTLEINDLHMVSKILFHNGLRKTRWNCGLPIRCSTEKTGWKG